MDRSAPFRILVVDDDGPTREAHARLLRRFGYEVETAEDGVAGLGMLPLEFDLLVVDAEMPYMDGFDVAEQVRSSEEYRHLPIVMVTGLVEREHRRRALSIGINDFVNKPVDPDELEMRTKWLLHLKRAFDQIEGRRAYLERAVEAGTKELRSSLERVADSERRARRAHVDTVRRLMIAAEYKDVDTAGHIERIGRYSAIVAKALALAPGTIELIEHAAPMHDVGKIGIPDRILLKPGKLDEEEWAIMRSHTSMGERILARSESPLIQMGERIAASHHEKWDGSGYPRGLSGDAIPIEGRICAVVDFFDALTMDRPYRGAVPVEDVIQMMLPQRGTSFNAEVLDAFLGVRPEIEAMRNASLSRTR